MVEVALARSGRAVTLEFVRRAEDLAAALEACSAIDRSFALDDLFDGALGEGEEGTPVMPGLRSLGRYCCRAGLRCELVGTTDSRGAHGGMTAPEPFTMMELCWGRCFGGPRFHANPVGRGIAPDPNDPEGRVPLPNIEHPTRVIRSPAERPEPAGAWPVPRAWPERARFLGT